MTNSVWRLIPLLEAPGEVQMAIDRWLLEKHRKGQHPPTLRFYTWSPAAISLGYHQREYPPYWRELLWQGKPLEIVRRPTGGRAVLHQGDLTYAAIASAMPGKRLEVYKQICQFLIDGWRSLGVELYYGTAAREYIDNPNCFATATSADLVTATGEKAIGSAQLRRGKAILQHGSMMLSTDRALFEQLFAQPAPANLQQLFPHKNNNLIPTLVETLSEAARACFKIELQQRSLSGAEWQDIFTRSPLLAY
ncbi:lipoate--protein ligase family protein [Pleurocapsales cyanobacterium LEGE 06147]|nr:lipoate--protein ligase family protein [Pleurocapsales cyanobacterium LEGE 06147]